MGKGRRPTLPKGARLRPAPAPAILPGGKIVAPTRAPTEGIAGAIQKPTPHVLAELNRHYKRLAMALAPKAHAELQLVFKAIAHALLYRAQFHGIPPSELRGFLQSLIPMYKPRGQKLGMSKELQDKLEKSAGMPQWPGPEERQKINDAIATIYRETDHVPAQMQLRIFWHMLMTNCERLGMTHEAVLLRLEVLDRLQREEGPALRFIPAKPPKWLQLAQEQKR